MLETGSCAIKKKFGAGKKPDRVRLQKSSGRLDKVGEKSANGHNTGRIGNDYNT